MVIAIDDGFPKDFEGFKMTEVILVTDPELVAVLRPLVRHLEANRPDTQRTP